MTPRDTNNSKTRGSWIRILLFLFGLLLLSAVPAHAQSVGGCVANFGGVIDGLINPVPPSQINIDGNCTIRNFPASNPLTSNISFAGTGRGWLVVFDNVDFIGNLSCDKSHGNFIWFVNGSITRQHILNCANLFAPVDKIDKENPPGPPFVSIGVPFTYTLTFPQLVSATTGAVVNPNGSNVEVDQATVTDNLNATGVSLNYVNSSAVWKGSGAPVPFTATNASGLLTFSGFPAIPAGQQIVLSVTVVLNNAVPPNSPGTQFSNTANWTLGTTIGGTFRYPLPGQQGVSSPPLTIAAPGLVMTKGGPSTMNPGQLGQFTLNAQNTGNSDAWNATIVDKLPTGATGGMCTATPQILSAQVFQADGVTPVPGKGPLTAGTGYTLSYAGAPACTLTLNMLSAAAVISPTQRLIVTYQTQLDANTQDGATLTNVAGTTLWFNGPSSATGRQSYTCTLTNGTPGVLDCQDAHTVTTVVPAVTIAKQVTAVGGGAVVPGGQLDYLVHVTNTSTNPVNPVVITDNLNTAGPGALTYVAGTATMNGSPNGVSVAGNVITANYSATYGPLAPGGTIDLRFRATLGNTLTAGTTVTNTGVVTWNNPPQTASASVSVTIGGVAAPNLAFTKSGPATMSLGQWGQFGFNVQNTGSSDAWNVTLLDELPNGSTGGMCNLTPQVLTAQVFQADGVTPVAGPLVSGTDFSINYIAAPTCKLTLTMLTPAATIGPNQRLIIAYQTQLDANSQNGAKLTNIAGAVQWFNADSSVSTRQAFNRALTDGTPGILDFQDAHTVTAVVSTVAITKQVTVVGGGAAMPASQLDYLVHVTNTSTNPVNPVVITDNLNTAGPGALTYVAGTATMNGSPNGVSVAGNVITANYSATYGPLAPGGTIDLRFRATLGNTLTAGTTVTNTGVVTWNNPPQTASASVSVTIGAVPGAGSLNGTAWLDANFNKIADAGELRLQGWTVALFRNGAQLQSVLTDVNGVYRFNGVPPTDGTPDRYEVRFTAPGAGPNTAKLGKADSAFTNSLQRITDIAMPAGSNVQNLNLPIGPNGVVYNSITRAPIAGATLNMLRAGSSTPLPAACFDDPAQQGQITQGGYYRFDLNFSDPACPSGGSYLIVVSAPTSNYAAGESLVIPPTSGASTAPFSVPTCPGSAQDALPTIPHCEAQVSEFAPPTSVPARSAGTRYYLNLTADNSAVPGSSQIYNNHIPLDPQLTGAFSITKTTPLLNVTRGQLVPYTITIGNAIGASLQGVQIVDRYPAGFRYVSGSARLDGQPMEPTVTAGQLVWNGLSFGSSDHRTLVMFLAVGAGVGEGEFVNRAQVMNSVTGKPLSGEATATVRVVPDQTFDCTDVFGKVFNDVNRNGVQDDGEVGLAGVRVVTATGLTATTDQFGRFHITCAITPNESRGSNFVLKLDDRTLPSGFRLSTDQVQVKRATRGKALKFDFGASIHRIVAIDLSDEAFEPDKTEIRAQWKPRLDLLLAELRKAPSVLRLSYIADTENAALVEQRMQAVERQLTEAWDPKKESYLLTIEPETFWRRGGPVKRPDAHVPGSK